MHPEKHIINLPDSLEIALSMVESASAERTCISGACQLRLQDLFTTYGRVLTAFQIASICRTKDRTPCISHR